MKKINFVRKIMDLKNEPLKGMVSMKEIIANTIVICRIDSRKISPIRMLELARKIYHSDGEIEIEDDDYINIKSIIENSADLTILVKGQILSAMEETK